MISKLKSIGYIKIISVIATGLLILLGIASTFVPDLAIVGENLVEFFIILGATAAPGMFAKGTQIGESIKLAKANKKERKNLTQEVKVLNKSKDELKVIYAPALDAKRRVDELGGALTVEEELSYNNYLVQSTSLDQKIIDCETRINELNKPVGKEVIENE